MLQTASNANLTVDGVSISSASNSVKDAIAGVTLDLLAPTALDASGNSVSASINLSRDPSSVKTKVQTLVSSYNDVISMLGVVSDPKSTVDTYGGTLVGNSIVSTIRAQVRNMVIGNSNSPSGSMTALRDIGVSVDKNGQLQIDANKLDGALNTQFDDVVKMLSNNQENQTKFNPVAAGIAGESFKTLDTILDPIGGTLATLDQNQTAKINAYQKQMDALQTRLQEILTRYVNQFSAMDSLVGSANSLRTSLTSSFAGMMAMYTRN